MVADSTGESLPSRVAAVVVAAGRGLRAGPGKPKQFRLLGGRPILSRTVRALAGCPEIERAVLVVPDPEEAKRLLEAYLPSSFRVDWVRGGETRQASTAAGLAAVPGAEVVLVHDGVRPLVGPELIRRVLRAAARHGAAVPVVPVAETLKRLDERGRIVGTERRERFGAAQTPQGFRRPILEEALRRAAAEGYVGTDEAELVERLGRPVVRVDGDPRNLKLTTPSDFEFAERLLGSESAPAAGGMRVGVGFDSHLLVPGRPLVLGGVIIPFPLGPAGHSDGDLVCHAATDAILGAAGLPDIGQLFPDTDPRYRGARSLDLLASAAGRTSEEGFAVGNLDVVVIAEEPRLAPHLAAMRANLARALGGAAAVGVKGKRGEGLGMEGRREGMSAHAVALLYRRREV